MCASLLSGLVPFQLDAPQGTLVPIQSGRGGFGKLSLAKIVGTALVGLMLWGGNNPVLAEQSQADLYDAKGKRDPFVALVRDGRLVSAVPNTSPGSSLTPVLGGILWDPGGQSIALINAEEVKVGDKVGDYQVSAIRQDAVVLVRDGEPLELRITFEEDRSRRSSEEPGGGNSQ